MSEIKQLFNQTLIYGFSSVVARVLNFFLVPLYTILFMPSEYAIVAEMYAYAALLMVVGSFGMETSFFRFFKENLSEGRNSVFASSFIFLSFNSLLLLLIGIFFHPNIAHFLGYENHSEYIIYFVFIIAFDLLCVIPFALLRQQNKAIKFATIKTINILLNIFFNIFFLLLCPKLLSNGIFASGSLLPMCSQGVSVGHVFIANLIASVATFIILIPEIKKNITLFNYNVFKKMLVYAWPILIAGIAFIINETADKILIKHLMPKGIAMRELGIYSACYKLTIFMTLFVQAYRFAAEPFFFNQFKKPNAKKIYSLMMEVFILFALWIFLFIVLYIDVIKFIIPNNLYHEGITIIPIVLCANIFLGIYYNLSVWYKVTNRTKYAAIISSLGALTTIILNIVLIPILGYVGAAWATLFCYLMMVVLSFYYGQIYYRIKYKTKTLLTYFFIALSLFFCSSIFDIKLYKNIQIDNTVIFFLYTIFIYYDVKKKMQHNVN